MQYDENAEKYGYEGEMTPLKCDELKSVYIDRTGDWCRSGNDTGKFYLKEDVDAAIAELKEFAEDACLERDDNQNAIDELQAENVKLKAENKLLKEHIANGDVSRITWIDEVIELKQKLEDVQASMYADVVDANMEVRRLRRALYKACANWAHHRVFVRFKTDEKAWEKMERKCRAKAEEYK